jgi:dethiobiotin synthetase
MQRYFITGIDTNVGKTVVSAILAEALGLDYWKPIQCGVSDGTDANDVRKLVSNSTTKVHPEAYSFAAPVSPHLAAAIEGKKIELKDIILPSTQNGIIIEGAGGMLVPLNKNKYVIQLADEFGAHVILVVRNYIGCINHSLLSIDHLLRNKYKVKGMILNGNFDPLVEQAIRSYSDIPVLAKFAEVSSVDKKAISEMASTLKKELFK